MTLSNAEIVAAFNTLSSYQNADALHHKVAYAFGKNRRALQPLFDAVVEAEQSIARQYTRRRPDGTPKWTTNRATGEEIPGNYDIENVEAFSDDRKELLSEQVDVPSVHSVDQKFLVESKGITPAVWANLDWMIREQE